MTSSFLEGINLRRGPSFPDSFDEGALIDDVRGRDPIQKITANWDPSFPGENTNWYDEYIHRNSPIAVSWLERPRLRDSGLRDTIEAKGIAVYQHGHEEVFAVSPLDDGSVCLWDVKGTRPGNRKGSILQKSQPGLLRTGTKSPFLSPDCVSIDNSRGRAFFAGKWLRPFFSRYCQALTISNSCAPADDRINPAGGRQNRKYRIRILKISTRYHS